jgi:exopolysaccharide biosynthesis predicted pyruvyltransferase EpsI
VETVGYIDSMRNKARASFDHLHRDVTTLVFTDFPDYANVGDSAIAMGQARYWRDSGMQVKATYTAFTLRNSVYKSTIPVLINGGGNLGGLYPRLSEHRYRLAERLNPNTMLIQAPQSVHFPHAADRDEFLKRMSRRVNLRIAVRDHLSQSLLVDHAREVILSPDAVHLLGHIQAPRPERAYTVLARTDAESAQSTRHDEWADWIREDSWWIRNTRRVRQRTSHLPCGTLAAHRSNEWWMAHAKRRLDFGVRALAAGETVVTDRLHAVLMALQMGRRVIAADNNNGKIRTYAETWFGDTNPDLVFADSIDHGVRMLGK